MRRRGLIAAGIAASLALPVAASAATIEPTTGDDNLGVPSDCSLREAVQAANTNLAVDTCDAGSPGADTIVLTGGETYVRTLTGMNEQANATGDIDILAGEPVTIQVSGPGITTISGNTTAAGDRVIENFAAGTVVDGVEITGGQTPTSQGGGGIRNAGSLTLRNSAVTANKAASFGGGIANANGNTLIATNVTVFDNQANQTGGGIDTDSGGNTTLNNVSIVGNSTADTVASGEGGGGFYAFGNTTTVTLSNSIVEGNLDTSIPAPQASDCDSNFPTITSQGYNLIGSLTGCTFTPVTGDLTGTSAGLEAFFDNGGGARTLGLHVLSPAVNAGNPAPRGATPACDPTDQRGVTRQTTRCDIGAFELIIPGAPDLPDLPDPFLTCGNCGVQPSPQPKPKPKCTKRKPKKAVSSAKKKGCKKPKKRK